MYLLKQVFSSIVLSLVFSSTLKGTTDFLRNPFESKGLLSTFSIEKDDSERPTKWNAHLGLGIGYLPFAYVQFTPTMGVYDEKHTFHEIINSSFLNVTYKNLIMLENRLTFQHYSGHYHDYYNTFYNHTYVGLNLFPLLTKIPFRDKLFIKFGLGVTNNCTCGDDVPYVRPGMFSRSYQLDYYRPLNRTFALYFSIGNNLINSDVPGKYNFTEYQIGVTMRLF